MIRVAVCLAALGLLLAAPAAAAPTPLLGVYGPVDRFERATGQRTEIGHVIVGWGQVVVPPAPVPMIGITTAAGWPNLREAITPRDVALGKGDAFLFALNDAIARAGRRVYVRPFPEMNGHWNVYCAYTKSGRAKGPSHSTASFRKAFARVYLIVHGARRPRST